MIRLVCLLFPAVLLNSQPVAAGSCFYDFEDNYIGDWTQRCQSGTWYAVSGEVRASTSKTCTALSCPQITDETNVLLTSQGTATHALGLIARLEDGDSGIYAYVSPDANVARIRRVAGGFTSTILASLTADFPSYVDYELTFQCFEEQLHFEIFVPSTSQSWVLDAVDDAVVPGDCGLVTGDEDLASWEWFAAETLIPLCVSALEADDDMTGESQGDGDRAFEPGEEVELAVALSNQGGETLTGVTVTMEAASPLLTVTDATETFGSISPGGAAWCADDFGIFAALSAPAGEYPLTLHVTADGGFDAEIEMIMPVGCGVSYDCESGSDGWTSGALETGWGDQWHVSTTRNHTAGGTHSFKCGSTGSGDYADLLYCAETGPWFNAPLGGTLTFWMWTDIQEAVAPGYALDGGLVRLGQFTEWTDVDPTGGYPWQIVSGTTGPFDAGTGVYSGTQGWQQVSFPVPSDLAGPVRMRLVFGSDATGNREGWYVDDILLEGSTGVEPDPGTSPTEPLLDAFPNPFRGAVTISISGVTGSVQTLEVYDLSGRLVSELSATATGGAAVVQWDGATADGGRLPPGIYVLRCRLPGGESIVRRLIRTE